MLHRQSIIDFFEAVVDINSNKLVLAVSTYIQNPIQNDWFLCCAEIYSKLGDAFIFSLMDLFGIDDRGSNVDRSERTWLGVRKFFERKLPELKQVRDESMDSDDGKSRLYGAVLDEVIDTLERQLSEMAFFRSGEGMDVEIDEDKMEFAPLTNLGCESEFAKLDVRIVASGGSTSVQTHSRKNIVTTNRLLSDPSFTTLSNAEKRNKWKWARTSDNVSDVKEIESNCLHTVKMTKRLALMKKQN